MTHEIYVLPILCLILATGAIAQEANSNEQPTRIYYRIQTYSGIGTVRDFATSPLFYRGHMAGTQVSRLKRSHAKETVYGVQVMHGNLGAEINDDNVGNATFTSFHFNLSKLYQVPRFSDERWNVKAGGTIDANANLRVNPAYQNNQLGLEGIFTLSASGKATRDISRTERKKGKILFINYSLPPRVRTLSYKLDIGFFNNNYRNGYIYANQSPILNDVDYFYDYEFNVFSGFRLGYKLDYTLYNRKNSNAVVVGIARDGYKTGEDFERLEASALTFSLSLLFNSK